MVQCLIPQSCITVSDVGDVDESLQGKGDGAQHDEGLGAVNHVQWGVTMPTYPTLVLLPDQISFSAGLPSRVAALHHKLIELEHLADNRLPLHIHTSV